MLLNFEERHSDSPYIDRIWRTRSHQSGPFVSVALSQYQMCIWTREGKTTLTLRGPETKATPAFCPPDTDFFGIVFKLGTFLPDLPGEDLVDRDLDLPPAGSKSFWLKGSAWEYPTYDNVDQFVERLVREGLLVEEPVVVPAVQGRPLDLSLRSVQRRFLRATALTNGAVRQIERARYATTRLKEGTPILEVVHEAGYADQPHLTRSLKHLIGKTPAQLKPYVDSEQLSFLFKTNLFP